MAEHLAQGVMGADTGVGKGQVVGAIGIQSEKSSVGTDLKMKGRGALEGAVEGVVLAEPVLCSERKPADSGVGFRWRNILKELKVEINAL